MRIGTYYGKDRDNVELNYFKDKLFDILNETDEMDISDITADDRRHLLTVTIASGSVFEIVCQQVRE